MTRRRSLKHFKVLIFICYLIIFLCCNSGCGTDYSFFYEDVESYKQAPFSVCYVDVGQGDCSLVQCGGEYMLIDSGEEEYIEVVSDHIDMFGVSSFKYVVITHPHSDHMGGMYEILSEKTTDFIIMPEIANDISEYEKLTEVIANKNLSVLHPSAGDVYQLGDSIFTILAPCSAVYEDINNYSVVIKFDYMETSFLFTGDCEKISEEEMLRMGYDISSDVIKVAHHGSMTSSDKTFIRNVRPMIAVIQVGRGNEYGHPHHEVLQILEEYCIHCYRTDEQGSIIITSDGTCLGVMAEKGFT